MSPSQKIKIVIADDEQLICSMLTKLIRADELQLEICGIAYDGQRLLDLIEEKRPEIVITDICMPLMDGLGVINHIRQRGIECRFIIISGYRQFDYAYNALKYNVTDYLLKPIDPEELNSLLGKLCEEIRLSGSAQKGGTDSGRIYLLKRGFGEITDAGMENVNATYGTAFKDGLFQAVYVKFDFQDGTEAMAENSVQSLRKKATDLAKDALSEHTFDLLFDECEDGVRFLCNYTSQEPEVMARLLPELLKMIKSYTDRFAGLFVTIGASLSSNNLSAGDTLFQEASFAIWKRMFVGLGNVIFWQDQNAPGSPVSAAKVAELIASVERSFSDLNVSEFVSSACGLFSLSSDLLLSSYVIKRLLALPDFFFEKSAGLIALQENADELERKTRQLLSMSYTIDTYKDAFITSFKEIMEGILENAVRQNLRPIRQAEAYIEKHYSEPISLDIVAKHVALSTSYFSTMFKKETGSNFSDYIAELRIKKARELLKGSNLNVNQIAETVGFNDARYFSRLFKKMTGMTPGEYRKVFG